MATTKAGQQAVHRYVKKTYDRLELTVPKGMKERIKDIADANNESVNGYITRLVFADLQLKGVNINE